MSDIVLNQDTMDWFLPMKHESFYWPHFVPTTTRGRTFLDVGAHVGTWTLPLARHFERVFAFEPDPRGWRTLEKNLASNKIQNVEVIPKAVSDKTGRVSLTLFPNPCTNTMMNLADCGRVDAPVGSLDVECVSIDEFVESRGIDDVDLIKVDTEAAEMLIVEGARRMFERQRPDFFIEMHGLFYKRLRAMLPHDTECDVIDGGKAGLSLVRHRDSWPLRAPESNPEGLSFKVYPHPASPSVEDMREIRRQQGIAWDPPTGFMSVDG